MIRWHECKRHPVATVVVVVSLLTVVGLVVLLAANPADPPPRVPAWLPDILVPTSANAWPGAATPRRAPHSLREASAPPSRTTRALPPDLTPSPRG